MTPTAARASAEEVHLSHVGVAGQHSFVTAGVVQSSQLVLEVDERRRRIRTHGRQVRRSVVVGEVVVGRVVRPVPEAEVPLGDDAGAPRPAGRPPSASPAVSRPSATRSTDADCSASRTALRRYGTFSTVVSSSIRSVRAEATASATSGSTLS